MGLDLVHRPILSPSHTSTKNGEFTSQFTRTRLDAMEGAYECKHINSHIEFSWFVHSYTSLQYDSIPCNHHVNSSILHALTYHFSHTIHAMSCKQHTWTISVQKSLPECAKQSHTKPRTVRGQSLIKHSVPVLGIGTYGHSRPHNSQTIFMAF